LERQLSSVFVKMTGYGTRASSLVRLRPDGISITERSFDASGLQGTVHLQWPLSH
jgi:uncharacterized protein with NRDE domain